MQALRVGGGDRGGDDLNAGRREGGAVCVPELRVVGDLVYVDGDDFAGRRPAVDAVLCRDGLG